MPMNGLECFGMFYMGWWTGDCGMLREMLECFGRLWNVTVRTLECYGKKYEHMDGLECFGMFYMGWGTGDSGMLREIVECFGRLWNVSIACGMLSIACLVFRLNFC